LPEEPIAARRAYFIALREQWPQPLQSLRANVLPEYRPRRTKDGHFVLFESWPYLQADPDRATLLLAIQQWAARFRITEEWIFQTALDTLQGYSDDIDSPLRLARPSGSEKEWYWLYAPRKAFPFFQPKFTRSIWYPQTTDWEIFRERMTAGFNAHLESYRELMEEKFGKRGGEHLVRDAVWTARYQKGDTAIEIHESEPLTGYKDPEQAIWKAISTFARLIGLRLRKRGDRIQKLL
jgi:hypothetical protein